MTIPIQALTWDFGGVLLRTEDQTPRRRWERELALSNGELHDIVFYGEASRRATIGHASPDDIWQSIGERLGLNDQRVARLQEDFWAGDELDHALIQTTRLLRKHLKTALLSNAWPDLRPYIQETLQIEDAFDVIIISAEEGIAKPDPQIYNLLIDRLDIPAGACLFIDDSQENILAAEALGIHGILFRDRDQTLHEILEVLPPEAAAEVAGYP